VFNNSAPTSKLENLGGEVLKDRSDVDGGFGSDSDIVRVLASKESEKCQNGSYDDERCNVPVNTTDGEL
jgi:hypothetical protein